MLARIGKHPHYLMLVTEREEQNYNAKISALVNINTNRQAKALSIKNQIKFITSAPTLRLFPVMAMFTSKLKLSLLLFLFSLVAGNVVYATIFTLHNRCTYTVWPGTLSGNGAAVLGHGGFALAPDSSVQLTAPRGWSGRFWARTGCNFDDSGNGKCLTGDCGSLKCVGGGAPPVTLAEFTIGSTPGDKDFYDVSLVDGYNVAMGLRANGGTGDCQYAGCVADLNGNCPPELRVTDSGKVVACRSACAAFNAPEFCCTGDHATPQTCSPTQYSVMFKTACPTAYSYAYDDASSTCTCAGSDYLITFCPTGSS